MWKNSVLQLRQMELKQSTRIFKARGSKVLRCESCLLPKADCICAARPVVTSHSAFCLVMYRGEAYKPSNTGRLIADVVTDNRAFLWDRTQPDKNLLDLLQNPVYSPILIFPHEYAEAERCIHHPNEIPSIRSGKIPLFVLLDGTWREARKMFKSSYLSTLPVLGIQPAMPSSYLMRDAAHLYQLCTAEVGIAALKLAGDSAAAQALQDYFSLFCKNYMVLKPHLSDKVR